MITGKALEEVVSRDLPVVHVPLDVVDIDGQSQERRVQLVRKVVMKNDIVLFITAGTERQTTRLWAMTGVPGLITTTASTADHATVAAQSAMRTTTTAAGIPMIMTDTTAVTAGPVTINRPSLTPTP